MPAVKPVQPTRKPAEPGLYVLVLRLPRQTTLSYGGTTVPFAAGWYAYVGSAMGGLAARVARHLRTSQVRHWHIDALLAAGTVADVQLLFTTDPAAECRTAAAVRAWPGAVAIPRFGCSDCDCPTHLVYSRERPRAALSAEAILPRLPVMYAELRKHYENHALWDRDPFQTLIKCILSLRTQDPVTDAAAERLFAVVRTPQALAVADPATLAPLIYPVGMYRQKARRIVEIARQVLERFGGETPAELADLVTLPGVGQKTANLVRSFAFHLPAICVDTHVHRISNRWGLVRTATPDETECELRRILPPEFWIETNALLIQHGQQVCRPIGPRCERCFLVEWCGYAGLRRERALLAGLPGAPPHPSLTIAAGAPGHVTGAE